jgi:pimeloyl-ACP methyl ester carboxylesterase
MLNSQVEGTGLPVIFLHGYGEDLSLWDEISVSLSKKYQVISIDLPGFGQSSALHSPFTLSKVAEIVHNHINNVLKIDQFVVFGHSLGGYISLALAESYPHSILAFGLINSTSFADTPEKKDNRGKTIDFINKHGAQFFLKSFVPNLFTPENQQNLTQKVLKVAQMGKNLPNSVLTGYMSAMQRRPDMSHLLSQNKNILFVAGLLDPHFQYKDILLEIGLLKNSKNGHLLEKVAHMSMIEAEKQLEIIIDGFLGDL